jgi:hypothetical protein
LSDALAALPAVRARRGRHFPAALERPPAIRTTADDATAALRISAQDVTADFFDTLGIPVVNGRTFDGAIRTRRRRWWPEREAGTHFSIMAQSVGRRSASVRRGGMSSASSPTRDRRSYNTLEWLTNPTSSSRRHSLAVAIDGRRLHHLHIRAGRPLSMAEIKQVAASLNPRLAVAGRCRVERDRRRHRSRRSDGAARLVCHRQPRTQRWRHGLVVQSIARRLREIGIRLTRSVPTRLVSRTATRRVLEATSPDCGWIDRRRRFRQHAEGTLYGVAATDAWPGLRRRGFLAVTAIANSSSRSTQCASTRSTSCARTDVRAARIERL